MSNFFYIIFLCIALCFSSSTGKAQNMNEKVYQQLFTIDKLSDNHTIYKLLDSLHQLKGLTPKNLTEIKLRLTNVAIKLQKFDEASKLAYQGAELAEKNHLDTAHATFYKLIGSVNYYVAKPDEAIKYFKKSAAIAKEKNILFLEVTNYQNTGAVFIDLKRLDSGEIYLQRAINLSKNCGAKCILIRLTAFRLLATLYQRRNEYIKAEQLYITAGKEAELSNDTTVICSFLIYHSDLLFLMGQKQQSLNKGEAAVKLMRVQQGRNDHSFSAALQHLADKLHKTGNYQRAYEVQKEAMGFVVQTYKKEGQQQVNELETKFKVKEIEQEKNMEKANAHAAKQDKRLLFLALLGVVLLAAAFFVAVHFRNKKKQAEERINAQKALVSSILETEEKERSRIAKDLHDGIVQDLTAIKLDIKSIVQQAPENLQTQLNKILSNVDVTSKEVREISYQMMPVTLRELGLLKAVEELLNRSLPKNNIEFEFDAFGIEERLSEKIETTVYRICQELINNTIKHSQATSVSLLLQLKNNMLQLTYEDNGVGFNSSTVKKGIGLNSLNSRIEMVKGSLEFDATESNGTTAYIRIPV